MKKEEKMIHAIGGIDDKLIEGAKAERATAPKKERRHVGLKRAIVIALAAVLTVCGLLMLNANVRAAVIGLFVYQDDDGFRVHFEGSDAEVDIHDVTIGYIPEGFAAREITDEDWNEESDPDSNGFNPNNIRQVRLVREEDLELPDNVFHPTITININRAGVVDWGYDPSAYEMTYESKINGMDAIMIHDSEIYDHEITNVQFSDDKITVNIWGAGISIDEVMKVAENISW